MYRLLVIVVISLLGLLASAAALSDVNKQCVEDNSEALSNDFLVGSWYEMYRFTLWGTLPPSIACLEIQFRKPTAEDIAEYKEKYNDPNLPYSLDENPVIRTEMYNNQSWAVGMVTGNTMAKFYVLEPKSTALLNVDGYSVAAFRPLSAKYIMWHDCSLRGHTMQLYSNDRYAPVAEMEELIENTPQLKRLAAQRYCATY